MSESLDQVLRTFLLQERAAAARDLDHVWRNPLAERVDAGDAVAPLHVVAWNERECRLTLRGPAHRLGRFRAGDRVRLGFGTVGVADPELTIDSDTLIDTKRGREQQWVLTLPWGQSIEAVTSLISHALATERPLAADRAPFDTTAALMESVARAFGDSNRSPEHFVSIAALLTGCSESGIDETAGEMAHQSVERLADHGIRLTDSQARAFVASWSKRPCHLVQGPPGTGKTFLLALIAAALAWRGERILITAQTHRAIDNALFAVAELTNRFKRPLSLIRVSPRSHTVDALARAGIARARGARGIAWPARGGAIIGSTLLSARALPDRACSRVLFDEAAQITTAHATCALHAADRWAFFGDDRQLGPVISARHRDGSAGLSIFEQLRSQFEVTMLKESFRMNADVCAFPSAAFYGGELTPTESASERKFTSPRQPAKSSPLDEALRSQPAAVWLAIDHEGHRSSSPPEARAACDLAERLLCDYGVPASELAIVSPFRRQNRTIQRHLELRLDRGSDLPVVDTVERIQGQEREVIIVSLTCSDPDALRRDTRFFFSRRRLCVTLTRARTKLIVIGSRHLLSTYPRDFEGLQRVSVFHSLYRSLPRLEWSDRYLDGSLGQVES